MANKAFGSTASGGASALNLYVCYRASGGVLTTYGAGIFGLRVVQNQRSTFGISAILSGLAPNTYTVGMCGISSNATNWNYNEFGYISTLVFAQSGTLFSEPDDNGGR